MGDSASRSNTRATRTRAGGRARPPATPIRRRPKSSPSVGREQSPKTRKTPSGGPPAVPARPRSKASSPIVNDDDESPTKRQKRASTQPKRGVNGKEQVARKILSDSPEEALTEMCPEPPLFSELLEKSWMALHDFESIVSLPNTPAAVSDKNPKDEICLVCQESDQLTFCRRCVHAICSNCTEIDMDCRTRWYCSLSGLRCTKRRQKQTSDGILKEDDERARTKKTVKLKPGDFVELTSSETPRFVKSRAWAPDYDSDAETCGCGRDRVYFARIVATKSTVLVVEFLIYPDQTAITTLRENELLLTTTKYDIPRRAILGHASKPIVMSLDSQTQSGDCYLVRSRYDLNRRIRRPLLANGPADTCQADVVIDSRSQGPGNNLSLIEKAVQSLQLSSAPDILPCRDKERAEIERILIAQLRVGGGSGGGLYISGLPGTGKTATVRRVICGLQQKSGLPNFKYLEINALKLQAPRYAYTKLWEAISGQYCSPAKALTNLQKFYSRPRSQRRKQIIILVLDEFDYLVDSKTHNVIYNLFTFPTAKKSGLIVVGIANTLDLPERIGGRVFSRLGLQCMNFEPYTAQQIEQIILERLNGLQIVADLHAITLCAKTIASTSGDLRRALEIISTAVELCSADGGKLTINHVALAKNQFSDTPAIRYIIGGAVHELALLCAFLQELKQIGRHEADYDAVVRRLVRILTSRGKQVAPSTVIDRVLHEMSDKGLILLSQKRDCARPNLRLYTNIEDVRFALQKTSFSDITL